MKSKIKWLVLTSILIVIVILISLFVTNSKNDILKNSEVYEFENLDNYPEMERYDLLVYKDKKIYFWDNKKKKIVSDNTKILKNAYYLKHSHLHLHQLNPK